jgi:hypothetical protein
LDYVTPLQGTGVVWLVWIRLDNLWYYNTFACLSMID